MKKAIIRESSDYFPGFQLKENEKALFCGHSDKRVKNPLDNNKKYFETVILTNERLVTLSNVNPKLDAVSSIPLSQIDFIQYTFLDWDFLKVLLCMLGFIFYIAPGIIYLLYVNKNIGNMVSVLSGVLKIDIKLDKDNPEILNKFIKLMQSI